jgi:SAM-dependent methyltransferase
MSSQRATNSAQELTTQERIVQLLDHLGIERAHFAARMSDDWSGLAATYPARIRSLALICPDIPDIPLLQKHVAHRLVILDDQPPAGKSMDDVVAELSDTQYVILPGYTCFPWADPIADWAEVIGPTLISFLGGEKQLGGAGQEEGEYAGISYRISGIGEPLVLLPLVLSATQWDALLPLLNAHFRTILLTGPKLGLLPALEERGTAPGYRRLVRRMIDAMELRAGETLLDVGCGSGVVDRWLAHYTGGRHAIVGVDRSPYLLREAAALVAKDGLEAVISLRQGDAEALPFADDTFDAVISVTVMEEVDADLMMKELVRVTKAGGHIGVIIRGEDLPFLMNVPVRPDLKAKCEAPLPDEGGKGCASADLYRRFHQAGLLDVQMMPDLTPFAQPDGLLEGWLQGWALDKLTPAEGEEWRNAAARSREQGGFFMTWPHHCAVGTKPA